MSLQEIFKCAFFLFVIIQKHNMMLTGLMADTTGVIDPRCLSPSCSCDSGWVRVTDAV